jgi:crossover junction endodeoxyribonuclease RusA
VISITIPFPPAELNPNRKNGRHWAATNDIKVRYLRDCRVLTLQAMGKWIPPAGTLSLDITFVQPDKRRRDRDNLLAAMKSGLDGISQALGVDDQHFDPVTIRRAFGEKPGSVRVVIQALAATEELNAREAL